jgi:hypothetical protein
MGVFVEPLFGKEEPVGTVFVCYSRMDSQDVKNIIETNFISQGIPYFLDEKDIKGGEKSVEILEKALGEASCSVIVLSPNSINSKCVWFETGVLVGKGKYVIPFLVKVDNTSDFTKNLPDFIRRYQLVWDVAKLIEAVQRHVFAFGKLFDDSRFNKEVMPQLKQAKLTMTLEYSNEYLNILKFGYLLVRFGREDVLEHPANVMLREEGNIINKAIFAKKTGYDEREKMMKVEYLLPVHKKLGLKFKPFVDVSDLSKTNDIISILKNNGFQDVKQSGSAEKQRIYFLLPFKERGVVRSPEGILDNYLYPI